MFRFFVMKNLRYDPLADTASAEGCLIMVQKVGWARLRVKRLSRVTSAKPIRVGSFSHRGLNTLSTHSDPADSAASASMNKRETATGISRLSAPFEAAQEAVQSASASLRAAGVEPVLFVAYAASTYDPELLAEGFGLAAAGVPLIGCSTAGEIATGGADDGGVVVFALGGDGFAVEVSCQEVNDGDLRSAGSEVAGCVEQLARRESTVLLLLSDGLAGDQQEVVRGAYDRVGAEVPLVGGCAGDGLRMERTTQFFGSVALTNAIVAAAITSDGPIGIGVSHGWRSTGGSMTVTKSSGVVVETLDDEPALDTYLNRLDAPAEVRVDAAAFTDFAATRPIGLIRRNRDEIRFVAKADFENRTFTCFAEVPQGGSVSIMEGDAESVLGATDAACSGAVETFQGSPPKGFMVFDCIARKGVLGEGIQREISQIADGADGAAVAGFYSYGEFARTSGSSGFHNQTLVVLALG